MHRSLAWKLEGGLLPIAAGRPAGFRRRHAWAVACKIEQCPVASASVIGSAARNANDATNKHRNRRSFADASVEAGKNLPFTSASESPTRRQPPDFVRISSVQAAPGPTGMPIVRAD